MKVTERRVEGWRLSIPPGFIAVSYRAPSLCVCERKDNGLRGLFDAQRMGWLLLDVWDDIHSVGRVFWVRKGGLEGAYDLERRAFSITPLYRRIVHVEGSQYRAFKRDGSRWLYNLETLTMVQEK